MPTSDFSEARLRRFRDIRWTSYSLVWSLALVLVYGLYCAARCSIVREVRNHAMGMASVLAAAIDADRLAAIHSPEDAATANYRDLQAFITGISRTSPDIRYIYIMRRSQSPGAGETDFEYIVDQDAYDEDGSGQIERDEETEPPGTRYDAHALPAMLEALERPAADRSPSPDPPYPDVLSGYAPIRDRQGATVAIVGVDVTAASLAGKLLRVRIVAAAVWVLLSAFLMIAAHFLFRYRELIEIRGRLIAGLEEANARFGALRELLPVCASCRKVRNDQAYWDRVEAYLTDHPGASHARGLCPECLAKIEGNSGKPPAQGSEST
jgi:hypothetical protein